MHLPFDLIVSSPCFLFRLLPCITEHLTAEIVQLTVSDITRAIEWMKCSYLYVRMKKACSFSLIGAHNLDFHLQLITLFETSHASES